MTTNCKNRHYNHKNQYKSQLVIGCFFLSGFISLVYEICWIRKASLIFGSTLLAVSTVIGIFFFGLALGSYLFGQYARTVNKPLKVYALVECTLGILVLLNPLFFNFGTFIFEIIYPFVSDKYILIAILRLSIFSFIILPPSILIGATFPLIVRQYVLNDKKMLFSLSIFYGINTSGAALGCFLCGFYLIPNWGVNQSILVFSLANFFLGLLLLILKVWHPAAGQQATSNENTVPQKKSRLWFNLTIFNSFESKVIALLFFISGFASLANEIIWTRFLSLIIHNTVYIYTVTIGLILSGMVIGSFLVSLIARRVERPALFFSISSFLTGISCMFILFQPSHYWHTVRDTSSMVIQVVIIAIILLLPSILAGMNFPLALRMAVTKVHYASNGAGIMTAINTIGGICGSLVTAFGLIPIFGLQKSIYLSVALSLLIGSAALFFLVKREIILLKIAIFIGLGGFSLSLPLIYKTRIPQDFLAAKKQLIDFREGRNATLAVVRNRFNIPVLEIDRLWQGEKNTTHQIMAAHIPMALHQHPQKILIIGVGVGQTATRFLLYPVKQVDCVDIEGQVFPLIEKYFDGAWLHDKRVTRIIDDGRNYCTYTKKKYDLVAIEIGQLFRSGCAAFYTTEFYQDLKDNLLDSGIVCQFLPLKLLPQNEFYGVIKTFITSFPHATLWYNRDEFLLIGSHQQQPHLNQKHFNQMMKNQSVHQDLGYYYWGGPQNSLNQLPILAAGFLCGPESLKKMTANAIIYSDDQPLLEYETARNQVIKGNEIALLIDTIYQYCDNPLMILSEKSSDSLLSVIKFYQYYNLQNITGLNLYRTYLEKNDPGFLQQAFQRNPYNSDFSFALGKLSLQNKNFPQSATFFQQAIIGYPDYADAHYNLALTHMRLNSLDSAFNHLQKTIQLEPMNARAYNNLGIIFLRKDSLPQALSSFEKALECDPNYHIAKTNREKILKRMKDK